MTRLVRTSLALALSFGPLACGGGGNEGSADAGQQPVADPASWGLADKTCWRYTDSTGQVAYTIEINVDTGTVSGVKTYQLLHRYNGFEQRREWLEVTADSLILHRRSIGTPPDLQLFTPSVVYLKQGIAQDDAVETATSVKVSNANGNTTHDATFSVSNVGTDTVKLPTGDVDATRYNQTLTGLPQGGGTDRLWFVPQKGIVKFNPAGTDVEEVLFHDSFAVDNSHPCNTL